MQRHGLTVVVFLLFFLGMAALQREKGAWTAEFGGTADEPAHFVTGLMVHDYLAAGAPWPPMTFARDYYLHYPKVGMGHWPPLFYVVQAVWMLAFGVGRIPVMLLLAALAALAATILFAAMRREVGTAAGVLAGLYFLTLPITMEHSLSVMAEMLLTALMMLGLLAYGRYLDEPGWRSAAWFAIISAAALLTKPTGVALATIPPIAILLTRRFGLVRQFSFWLPALIVGVLAGPWYLLAPGAQHEKVSRFGKVQFRDDRLLGTPRDLAEFVGVVAVLAAVVGLVMAVRLIYRRHAAGIWVAGAALLMGVFVCREAIGAWESRNLVAVVPVLLLFAGLGAKRIGYAGLAARAPGYVLTAVAAMVVVGLVGWHIRGFPPKRTHGLSETAATLLADQNMKQTVFLICAGPVGEGVFISEVAIREKRPGHYTMRGSQVLSSSTWMGRKYRMRFDDPEKALAAVEAVPTGVVVVDRQGAETPHGRQLLEGLSRHSERWKPMAEASQPAQGIAVFRFVGAESTTTGKIRLPDAVSLGLP